MNRCYHETNAFTARHVINNFMESRLSEGFSVIFNCYCSQNILTDPLYGLHQQYNPYVKIQGLFPITTDSAHNFSKQW